MRSLFATITGMNGLTILPCISVLRFGAARPPFTDELAAKLKAHLSAGGLLATAYTALGVTTGTIVYWRNRDPKFQDTYLPFKSAIRKAAGQKRSEGEEQRQATATAARVARLREFLSVVPEAFHERIIALASLPLRQHWRPPHINTIRDLMYDLATALNNTPVGIQRTLWADAVAIMHGTRKTLGPKPGQRVSRKPPKRDK